METKNRMDNVNSMSLGIVDTPGAHDTRGMEQDARNVRCIQQFLEQHQSLKGIEIKTTMLRLKLFQISIEWVPNGLQESSKYLKMFTAPWTGSSVVTVMLL